MFYQVKNINKELEAIKKQANTNSGAARHNNSNKNFTRVVQQL